MICTMKLHLIQGTQLNEIFSRGKIFHDIGEDSVRSVNRKGKWLYVAYVDYDSKNDIGEEDVRSLGRKGK